MDIMLFTDGLGRCASAAISSTLLSSMWRALKSDCSRGESWRMAWSKRCIASWPRSGASASVVHGASDSSKGEVLKPVIALHADILGHHDGQSF